MKDKTIRASAGSCKKAMKKLKKSVRRRRKAVRKQALGHRKRAALKQMARRIISAGRIGKM